MGTSTTPIPFVPTGGTFSTVSTNADFQLVVGPGSTAGQVTIPADGYYRLTFTCNGFSCFLAGHIHLISWFRNNGNDILSSSQVSYKNGNGGDTFPICNVQTWLLSQGDTLMLQQTNGASDSEVDFAQMIYISVEQIA